MRVGVGRSLPKKGRMKSPNRWAENDAWWKAGRFCNEHLLHVYPKSAVVTEVVYSVSGSRLLISEVGEDDFHF